MPLSRFNRNSNQTTSTLDTECDLRTAEHSAYFISKEFFQVVRTVVESDMVISEESLRFYEDQYPITRDEFMSVWDSIRYMLPSRWISGTVPGTEYLELWGIRFDLGVNLTMRSTN